MRRSRIKALNRWLLPILAIGVVAFALFPNQVLSVFGSKSTPQLQAGENEVVVTLSVPGMT